MTKLKKILNAVLFILAIFGIANVALAAAPTVSIYVSPAAVSYGGSTTVYWSSTDATACSVSPNSWTGTSGSQSTGALYSSRTYSVTCSGGGGSTTNSVTVSIGSSNGTVGSVTTNLPSNISSTGANLSCYFNNNGTSATTGWFEWGYNSSLGYTGSSHTISAPSTLNYSLTGLTADNTYFTRCVIQNSYGLKYGETKRFTTGPGPKPAISTKAATEAHYNYAVLNGYVDPNGTTDTAHWFEWGTTSALGNSTSHNNSGSMTTDFGESVIGLSNNTTYYFRAVAENAAGRSSGGILSFRTSDNGVSGYTGPSAVTFSAENISTSGAKLNGVGLLSVNVPGYGWFEWGSTAALGNTTSLQTLPRVSTAYFAEQLGGLTSGTTYYYRAVVKDANGIVSRGPVMNFRAGSTPVTPTYYPPTTPVQPKVYKATVTQSGINLTHPNGTNTNFSAASLDTIRFTIEAYNSGDYELEDTVVRIAVPDYLEFANAEDKNMNNPQREVTWYIGALEPGARKSMNLDVIVTANAPIGSSISNIAKLQSRKANADSNEVFVHVDPATSFGTADANGNNQTASALLTFGGLGWLWFNIIFTILVAAFTAFVINRIAQDRRVTATNGSNNLQ